MFAEHRDELLRFVRARDPGHDAEDVVQDLWVKVHRAASGPIGDPLAYLYRMANNLAIDRRRSLFRSQQRDHGWAAGRVEEKGWSPSAERALLARDQLRMVDQSLAGLGERTDRIFRRFRIEGATQERIAADMGISVSAVEKHLQKAYRMLLRIREQDDVQ